MSTPTVETYNVKGGFSHLVAWIKRRFRTATEFYPNRLKDSHYPLTSEGVKRLFGDANDAGDCQRIRTLVLFPHPHPVYPVAVSIVGRTKEGWTVEFYRGYKS